VKEDLSTWKKNKEKKLKVDLHEQNTQELRIQNQIKRKKDDVIREKKEMVEEFKFRKEMDQ
jgi:hypothetical protein